MEYELSKLNGIAGKYETAVVHIEDLKGIVGEVTLINPKTNLSYIIQNQARLVKSLPELHALSMKRFLDRFETTFTEGILLAKGIVENNKCITYLKSMLRQAEEDTKQAEREATEDMALMRMNTQKQIGVLESKIEKMLKKEQLDMQAVVDMKKEIDALKEQNETVISSVSSCVKDLLAYQHMHAQLIGAENDLIRKKSVGEDQTQFRDFLRTASHELKTVMAKMLTDMRSVIGTMRDVTERSSVLLQNIRVVDAEERSSLRQELDGFKRSVSNMKSLILENSNIAKDTMVDLKLFVDQLQRNTDSISQEFERQSNRYIELTRILEKRAAGTNKH